MATKFQVTQGNGRYDYDVPPTGTGAMGQPRENQTSDEATLFEEVVTEVVGTSDGSETDEFGTGTEASEPTQTDGHRAVSSPMARTKTTGKEGAITDESAEADEATDTESVYENVEGWQEKDPLESGAEAEPVVEASFADMESSQDGQEFFGALAALVVPLAKAVLPSLAGAAVKQGTKLVKGAIKKKPKLSPGLMQMLRQAGVNPTILKQLEFSEETDSEMDGSESTGVDESDIEALAQQIEALEVVIGQDDRVRVNNTTVIPWKRICHLKIQTTDNKSYLGTGFFIGPRTIVTAGHCVYIHGHGGWPRQIIVTPGRNDMSEPFQRFTATAFRSVQGWVNNKSRNFDYGVIQLPRNANVSPSIGAFGFGQFPDQFLLNKRLNTAGYPGDKPSGTMWFNGRKAKAVTARTITYDMDTAGGQSGSPVWFKGTDGQRIAVAIHTNGASTGNSATRISKPVFDNLKKWRLEGGAA